MQPSSTTDLTGANAEQLGSTHSLQELNKASVKAGGSWIVSIFCPRVDEYEYPWKGQQRKASNFMCTLVSHESPNHYCTAHFKKTTSNHASFEKANKTWQANASYRMSKVCFVEDAKTQYISSPIKLVVDLAKTKFEAIKSNTSGRVVQPAPIANVAQCSEFKNGQLFDVTALVHHMSEITATKNNRVKYQVQLLDGSLDKETQKVKILPLTFYVDVPKAEEQKPCFYSQLHTAMQENKAVTFFGIKGSQDADEKYSFQNTKHTIVLEAVGQRADDMNKNNALHSLQAEDTVTFAMNIAGSRDWSKFQGKETKCKLLASFSNKATGVRELDMDETIWQLNWVQVTEPAPTENIKTQDGSRIWFSLPMRDHTGHLALRITEQAALQLAQCTDAVEFLRLHADQRLQFPLWASVKVWRKPSKRRQEPADSSQDQWADFDCFIVEAVAQDLLAAPSAESAKLLPMLDQAMDTQEGVLPAGLSMIKPSPYYGLTVEYAYQEMPPELQIFAKELQHTPSLNRSCSQVIAMVKATQRSQPCPAGKEGLKMVTDNVECFAYPGDASKKYQLISYCTPLTVTDFKLDPPRGCPAQFALASITGIMDESLVVESLQPLSETEATSMRSVFRQLIYFSTLASQMLTRKRQADSWTDEDSPAKAKVCRKLGRSPTGQELPEYKP